MLRKVSLTLGLLVLVILSLSLAAAQDESFSLTVMHTNDTHSWHEPQSGGNGGVARQAAVVNQIRAQVDNSILLDAGDRFAGTLFYTEYRGEDNVQVMNLLGYDAMTLGNHEFDSGDQVLADFIAGLNFPVVSANIGAPESSVLAGSFSPYTVLEVGGRQVGVIGLTTAETVEIASPGDDLAFSDDYVGIANALAAELAEQGVNVVILLTHTGSTVDLAMMEQLQGIDLVIGGHSHTLYSNLYTGAADRYPLSFESASGEPIYYVQAGAYNVYLGRLDLQFNADGLVTGAAGDTILLSRYITPDPAVNDLVVELSGPIEELKVTPTGATTDVLLVGDRAVCRVEECNLGNVIADAMRAETGAQIAIMNGGGIRADIEPGEITLGEILTVQPFSNTISTFQLSGADVILALENGVSRLQLENGQVVRQGASGRFPQVSGIRFTIDPTQEPGSRIVSVEVQAEDGSFSPIDPEAIYTVVTNNFVRTGGDGYTVLNDNAINPYDFGRVDYEVTVDYMVTISPISAEIEGRIIYVNAEVQPG